MLRKAMTLWIFFVLRKWGNMSKPSVELSQQRAERVKALIYDYNANHPECKIRNKDIAERMGIDEVAFSGKMNAKRTITDDDAKKIAKIFNVRWQWIQGYDGAKTEDERVILPIVYGGIKLNLLKAAVEALSSCRNIDLHEEKFDKNNVDAVIEHMKRGFIVEYEGKKAQISAERYESLINDIADYMEFKVKKLIESEVQ